MPIRRISLTTSTLYDFQKMVVMWHRLLPLPQHCLRMLSDVPPLTRISCVCQYAVSKRRFQPLFFARFPAPAKLTAMPVSGTHSPFYISRKGAEAQRKAGKPACRAFTLRLCAFAGFWGDMFFPSALKRVGSDMRGQKSGQRKLANLDGLVCQAPGFHMPNEKQFSHKYFQYDELI